ncbi:hypothetical protein SUGI_0363870 [Cryptomeria japonica]|nr:hypothetical protein SUGI_0363870 [Cryptomeria japonica]
MDFRKIERSAEQILSDDLSYWRLASVAEVRDNMDRIKKERILDSWDIARLLDGWVDGPGYRYTIENEYKPNMGHMLLVRTKTPRASDGKFIEEMYSGVELNSKGRKAALLLSCDDKITEVMCFVLMSTIDRFVETGERQSELDRLTESLKQTFYHRRTVLHYAADQPHNGEHARCVADLILSNFEYGRELIKAGDKYGRTSLHYAAHHGHIGLFHFLIVNCGLDADEKDRNGENILHLAVNSNKIEVVNLLLTIMDGLKNLVASQDAKCKTPLHKAAANGNTHIICILLQCMNELGKSGLFRQADLFGQTALLEAARGGHKGAFRNLLQIGSKPLAERNSEGKTAQHYCVQLKDEDAATDMVSMLLDHCLPEERLLLLSASATGIGTAEQCAESAYVQSFLKQQRESEVTAGSSRDLLLSAVTLGYDKMAWELINRGANTSQLHNYNFSNSEVSDARQQRIKKFLQRVEKMPEGGRDQPTVHDSLGRRAFAEGLAALFLNPHVKSPATVGISGDWGMGKSSLMLQTEMLLLQAAAQLTFPDILPIEEFPGSKQFELTQKGRKKYKKVKKGVKELLPASEIANIDEDPLVYFLDNYQDKYPQVYKSLALMDRGELFRLKDETSDSSSSLASMFAMSKLRLKGKTSDSSTSLGKIPTILTVRYNAWYYQNESEALAGLAITISKAMEETMTKSQRIRSCWRYTLKERGGEIGFQFLLPCILALFLSGWLTWAFWMLLSRLKHSELQDLKYGSIPVTIVVVFWTVMRQLYSVFKPVSVQIMGYVSLPDHSKNLGYQHQVISDINFLKQQIRQKPSLFWKFLAGNWLWRMCGLYLDTIEGTSIPKTPPPSKDDIRIIVFVDDLDRCEDTVILQVLSAVNLVLAVCEINVILGMDKKMIARAIAHKYQHQYQDNANLKINPVDLADKYLSKIVQLPLALPDSGNEERIEFLNQQLGEEFMESGDDGTEESSQHSEDPQWSFSNK